MGFLYLLTSPCGKGYVGQTQNTIVFRWKQHIAEAFGFTPKGCPKLNAAIKKYDPSAFQITKLWECPDDELDDWEIYFVALFDTYGPLGYNLTSGGQGTAFNTSPESRQKLSDSHRAHGECSFPYGITKVENGYRVRIGSKFLRVENTKYSDEEKLDIALQEREKLLNGTHDETKSRRRVRDHEKDLPRHVSYDPRRDGYYVRKPGYPARSFTSKKLSREEKRKLAIEYVQR